MRINLLFAVTLSCVCLPGLFGQAPSVVGWKAGVVLREHADY